ncbi:hypothetical protein ACWEED_10110 [Micrococcus luteus]
MSYDVDAHWVKVAAVREALAEAKPSTAAEVIAILRKHDPMTVYLTGDAFYSGSGDGGDLGEDLEDAGWSYVWAASDYYYVIRHEGTGEALTYIEGDVYAGDKRPR